MPGMIKLRSLARIFRKYLKFIGPGLMVSVAYMDPGNYSTAVAAGSVYKYKLLFSILLSNCLAIFLQILSAKLGAVTGLDLAANCRVNLPHKLNILIYILAEIAIVATDLAEVVGTAIALNILFKIPLLLGVILTTIDVLIVLMAYRPNGPLLFVRIFESFVSLLVAATVICFGVELYQVSHEKTINFSTWEVLKGFLPNDKVVDMLSNLYGSGLYLSLAILGATVMPHSLYLGSGLVQARLKDYDSKHGYYKPLSLNPAPEAHQEAEENSNEGAQENSNQMSSWFSQEKNEDDDGEQYRPSIHAINDTMLYTIVELVISLFTVALFVNSAILIVAGATLHNKKTKRDDHHDSDSDSDSDDNENYAKADLFTIYNLLSSHLSPTAGFVFALALLCSGQSAGVVCTLAGQMVLEGFLRWKIPPVPRRLLTRGLAIAPCIIVVSSTGREGLGKILNASQVVLSILLPFVTAPLIWFTCSKSIMKVPLFVRDGDEDIDIFPEETLTIGSEDNSSRNVKPWISRFKTTEPAIRLSNLRKSHPCAGWEDDENFEENQLLMGEGSAPRDIQDGIPFAAPNSYTKHGNGDGNDDENGLNIQDQDEGDTLRVKGFKDMSNGPVTSTFAICIWAFITLLNMYLIVSALLGYDVPL